MIVVDPFSFVIARLMRAIQFILSMKNWIAPTGRAMTMFG
jgi:hypothetical protein